MGDKHSKSFFGQKAGLIVQSSSKNQPFIFFQCIEKKADQSWEKPSQGEGKKVKMNLEEIIWMLRVLNKNISQWTTYHEFKEEKTKISFNWVDDKNETMWINIGEYKKKIGWSQAELLRLLLSHILKEKIQFATVSTISKPSNFGTEINSNQPISKFAPESLPVSIPFEDNKMRVSEEVVSKEEIKKVVGEIKGSTEKALLINFSNGNEVWIPKSTIKSTFEEDNREHQSFLISSWVLQKNKIEI